MSIIYERISQYPINSNHTWHWLYGSEGKLMSLNKRITLLFPLSLILYELPLYLSNNLFLPALSQITKTFQVTNATSQLSIALWFLGPSVFQVLLGPLSDSLLA